MATLDIASVELLRLDVERRAVVNQAPVCINAGCHHRDGPLEVVGHIELDAKNANRLARDDARRTHERAFSVVGAAGVAHVELDTRVDSACELLHEKNCSTLRPRKILLGHWGGALDGQ